MVTYCRWISKQHLYYVLQNAKEMLCCVCLSGKNQGKNRARPNFRATIFGQNPNFLAKIHISGTIQELVNLYARPDHEGQIVIRDSKDLTASICMYK